VTAQRQSRGLTRSSFIDRDQRATTKLNCRLKQSSLNCITTGQSNFTTGRIAAAHGRFSDSHQTALVCIPHRHIPTSNMLPWAQNPKWHPDQFSCFCAAHHRMSLYFITGRPSSLKLPLPMGELDLYLIHGFLSPPESSTQTASWLVQLFLQGSLLWQTDRPCHSVGNNRPHLHTQYCDAA